MRLPLTIATRSRLFSARRLISSMTLGSGLMISGVRVNSTKSHHNRGTAITFLPQTPIHSAHFRMQTSNLFSSCQAVEGYHAGRLPAR